MSGRSTAVLLLLHLTPGSLLQFQHLVVVRVVETLLPRHLKPEVIDCSQPVYCTANNFKVFWEVRLGKKRGRGRDCASHQVWVFLPVPGGKRAGIGSSKGDPGTYKAFLFPHGKSEGSKVSQGLPCRQPHHRLYSKVIRGMGLSIVSVLEKNHGSSLLLSILLPCTDTHPGRVVLLAQEVALPPCAGLRRTEMVQHLLEPEGVRRRSTRG